MPISQDSIRVWVVPLARHNIERWRPVLSETEWERAMRFRMPADQARFAITRGVLRTLLSPYLLQAAADIEFSTNQFGKPSAPGGVKFNVAHSGDYALLAFASDSEVGVDVERIGADRVVSDLAQRVLSPHEYARFSRLPDSERTRTFFQIWTLKEAVLKAIGSGLSIAPECIEVSFYPAEPRLLRCSANEIADVNEWTVRRLSIGDNDYAAAVAVRAIRPSIEVKFFTEADERAHVP